MVLSKVQISRVRRNFRSSHNFYNSSRFLWNYRFITELYPTFSKFFVRTFPLERSIDGKEVSLFPVDVYLYCYLYGKVPDNDSNSKTIIIRKDSFPSPSTFGPNPHLPRFDSPSLVNRFLLYRRPSPRRSGGGTCLLVTTHTLFPILLRSSIPTVRRRKRNGVEYVYGRGGVFCLPWPKNWLRVLSLVQVILSMSFQSMWLVFDSIVFLNGVYNSIKIYMYDSYLSVF